MKISWKSPNGLFDFFVLRVSEKFGGTIKSYEYSNTTFSHLSTNLNPDTEYEFSISTKREYQTSNLFKTSFTTKGSSDLANFTIDQLIQANFTLLPKSLLIDLIDKKINETISDLNIDIISFIFYELAINSVNSEIMVKLLDLADYVFEQTSYNFTSLISNRFSQGLEKAISKINVDNLENKEFTRNYSNFYVKTKIIDPNFAIKDIGFILEGITKIYFKIVFFFKFLLKRIYK